MSTLKMTLSDKLTLAITVCAAFLISVSLGVIAYFDLQRIKEHSIHHAHAYTEAYNEIFIRIISFNTAEDAVYLTGHIQNLDEISSLYLYDINHTPIFSYLRHDGGTHSDHPTSMRREKTDEIRIYEPVRYQDDILGYVMLSSSSKSYNERVDDYTKLVTALALSLLIFSYLIARWLQRYFTDPITKLATIILKITDNQDYNHEIMNGHVGEVGVLYDGFNTMLRKIDSTRNSLYREKENAFITLNSIADAVVRTDEKGVIEYINPVAESLLGQTCSDALGMPIQHLMPMHILDKSTRIDHPLIQSINENRIIHDEETHYQISHRDRDIDVDFSTAPTHDNDGNISGAVIIFQDVGIAREKSRQISFQASHDSLTGLLNRLEFERRLNQSILTAKSEHYTHILCFIDLDKFKLINDQCGHLAGDQLLIDMTKIMRETVRDADLVARIGGDEFAIILHRCDIKCASIIAETLRERIDAYRFTHDSSLFRVGASIGIAEISERTSDIKQVIDEADKACYAAKDAGRNKVRIYC